MAKFKYNGDGEVAFYGGTTISKKSPVTLEDEFFIEKARALCAAEDSLFEEMKAATKKTTKKKASKKAK